MVILPGRIKPLSRVRYGKEILFTTLEVTPVLPGFKRTSLPLNSFASWLRKIEIKRSNTVYLYNGKMKTNQETQYAVLKISVRNRNLPQLTYVVMWLRTEHLCNAKNLKKLFLKIMMVLPTI